MDDVIARCMLLTLLVCMYYFVQKVKPYQFMEENPSIKDIAGRDLTCIGDYNIYLKHALKVRLTAMYKRLLIYNRDAIPYLGDQLLLWVKNECYDPSRLIENSVEQVTHDFLSIKEADKEAFAALNLEKELPTPSKYLLFNDHLNLIELDRVFYDALERRF